MKLQKDEKLLLVIITIYTLAATMVTTFANVYLLDYTNSFVVISIYSMLRYAMLGCMAVISAKLSRRIKMSTSLTIGLVLITAAVVFLLSVKEAIATNNNLVYLVGVIWGAGEGFFWIAMNTLIQICTTAKNRGAYLGIHGALGNLATIFAPLLSAQILASYDIELDGYYAMFKLAIVIFIFIAIISMLFNVKKLPLKFSVGHCFKEVKKDFQWRYVVLAQLLWGIRDAATVSLTGLLIYEAVGSGTTYGRLLSVFSVLATISNLLAGRYVKKQNRILCLVIGCLGLFFSGMALILIQNEWGAYMHGLFHYVFLAWASTPFSIIAMNVISDYMETENIIGRTVTREIMTALGRSLGLIAFVAIALAFPGKLGLNISLVVLYSFCIFFAVYTVYYDLKKHPRKKIDLSNNKG